MASHKSRTMESLYRVLPYSFLEVPPLKLKKPWFVKAPSSTIVYSFVLFSYFLVTGGIIYDVIVEPPSIGSHTDEQGRTRPVAFMQYRVNGQYIMEGLASSFLFTSGALSLVIIDRANSSSMSRLTRLLLLGFGLFGITVTFIACRIFMGMKLP